jgi:hypothetical protein
MLGRPLSPAEIADCFRVALALQNADSGSKASTSLQYISLEEFASWYVSDSCNPHLSELRKTKMAGADIEGSGALFG